MNILLDTHAFLWALIEPDKLSRKARRLLEDDSTDVVVSGASAWETATKYRLGKLPGAKRVVTYHAGGVARPAGNPTGDDSGARAQGRIAESSASRPLRSHAGGKGGPGEIGPDELRPGDEIIRCPGSLVMPSMVIATRMAWHRARAFTPGFRATHTDKFRKFIYLLPNGFSYPATSTMAFFRSAYPIAYLPIKAAERVGKIHIKPLRDGVRFLLIIFRIATLYSPLNLSLPASAMFFLLGCVNYASTFWHAGRLTNGSALLWIAAVIGFLIGLISEQITALTYRRDA